MMNTFWNAIQKREIESLKKTPTGNREEIDEMTLLIQSMWEVIKDKTGVTDAELEQKFEQNRAEAEENRAYFARVRGERVKCPSCNKIFGTRDSREWDGERHISCQARLKLEEMS